MDNKVEYTYIKPNPLLADFVESFWLLHNQSGSDREIIVLPDGRIDLISSLTATGNRHIFILGIGTKPNQAVLQAGIKMFAISFKLLAIEYIFQNTVSGLLDTGEHLPTDFWDFTIQDFNDFDRFCKTASQKIQERLPKEIDNRKKALFDLLYASNGSLSINELSEKVFWSSRQMNRYFNNNFGLSLKAYCNILRFRASFKHLKEGKLFPEENFADQSHFIKQVKKLSGVPPKELSKNQNDRFIQFSTLGNK